MKWNFIQWKGLQRKIVLVSNKHVSFYGYSSVSWSGKVEQSSSDDFNQFHLNRTHFTKETLLCRGDELVTDFFPVRKLRTISFIRPQMWRKKKSGNFVRAMNKKKYFKALKLNSNPPTIIFLEMEIKDRQTIMSSFAMALKFRERIFSMTHFSKRC